MATSNGVVKGKSRDVELERRWRGAMTEWSRSGLSVRAFCRQRNLLESRFFSWRRELRRRDAQREPRPPVQARSGRSSSSRRLPASPPSVTLSSDRRARRAAGSSPSPSFVSVRVATDGGAPGGGGGCPAGGHMEIVLSCGHRVRVAGPVDRVALAAVVSVLEGLPVAGVSGGVPGEASSC